MAHSLFSTRVRTVALLLCGWLLAGAALAQTAGTVTGKILDESGAPVAGASIAIDQTNRGTLSNGEGEFSISSPGDAVLNISFLGYTPQSIPVNNRTYIEVRMKEEYNPLDEIVVVGYGSMKKSDLTGSVQQVNMSSFEGQQAVSLADYLRGSVAGLNVSRSSSVSGQSSLQIRGTTSLGTGSSPLLVVDGIIFGGQMNDINPNDIETVSIMKDASSAAVYGASGADGVILITTKKGTGEKATIRFDLKTSISKLLRKEEMYGVDDYLGMRGDALRTNREDNSWTKDQYYANPYKLNGLDLQSWIGYDAGRGPNSDPTAVWLERLKLQPNEIENYYNYNSVDWYDQVFRTGVVQDYNLSVSGKTKNLSYYWSLGLLDNNGIVVNDDYQNIRSRVNLTNDITDFLQVGIRANLSSTNADGQRAEWSQAYDNSPLGSLYNDDGTYTRYPNEDIMAKNPLDKTQFYLRNRNIGLMGTVFAKLKLPYGFQFETTYDNRWRFRQGYTYKPSYTIDGMRDNGVADREEYNQYEWTLENLLRWNQTYGDHKIDVTMLQSAYKWESWQTNGGATNFNTSELPGYHNPGLGDIATSGALDQKETKASYMARVNYSYKDRYLLSVSWRRDGYSGFGQDNPWADFPGAALAWRISEEPFMEKMDWLTNLKLRLSYGKNGNSNFGRYKALATLTNGYYINDGKTVVTLYPSDMGNRSLQWEETTAFNAGLDIGLLRNRLSLTIDAYKMETTNQLLNRGIPSINGFTSVAANLGQIDNTGLEVSINSVNFNGQNFKWSTDAAFWLNRNKIKHLYGEMESILDADGNVIGWKESDDPTNGWYIGHSIDQIYGYKVIGIWQENEAEEARQFGRKPGDYKTYAKEGSTSLSSADYLWQGYTKPRFSFSVRNTFGFFNNTLELSFMLRSELGHKKANNELNTGSYAHRISQIKYPYWTYENPSNEWGALGASRTGTIYKDASFVRIENITLGYTLPARWMNAVKIQQAKVYFNMDNVHSFDNWQYWDPETKAPTPTTFTFGLNLTL